MKRPMLITLLASTALLLAGAWSWNWDAFRALFEPGASVHQPTSGRGRFESVSFEVLSSFPYRVYEVVSETGGRPRLKTDDVIPPHVKALDGREVEIRGYVLPLRVRKGLVTELLLLRDQGTCCFGEAAQINHFIRVKLTETGLKADVKTLKVSGTLHVGEMYVEGYLTGIYALTAAKTAKDETF